MKNNSYVNKMVKAVDSYFKAEEKHKAEIEKMEKKMTDGLIAPVDQKTHREKIRNLNNQYSAIKKEYSANIENIVSEYADAVNVWAQIKVENLPPDAALLASGIEINKNDLDVLAKKHWTNYTAQRLFMDYAKKHDIVFVHAPTPEKKIAAISGIGKFLSAVPTGGYNANFIKKEGALTDYLAQYESVLGEIGRASCRERV